jgi:hypothetical protein
MHSRFIDQASEATGNLVSVTAICDIITRMTESIYLFFDESLPVLRQFYCSVVPRLYDVMTTNTSKQVHNAMALLRVRKMYSTDRQAQVISELLEALGVSAVRDNSQKTTSQPILSLFASEPDWSSQAINLIITNISETMRIDAVQEDTYNTIEATVSSKIIFRGYNLNIVSSLHVRVGPALDAMSKAGEPSSRLTRLLNVLKANLKLRTPEQQADIDALCQVLGRETSLIKDFIAGDGPEDEEEDGDEFEDLI